MRVFLHFFSSPFSNYKVKKSKEEELNHPNKFKEGEVLNRAYIYIHTYMYTNKLLVRNKVLCNVPMRNET